MQKKRLLFVSLALSIFLPKMDFAQTAPSLGSTSTFAVYTAAGAISVTNGTTVNGDLGNDAGAITGYSGTTHQADPAAHLANTDVHTLFAALSAMPCTNTLATFTGNQTLTGHGVYCFGAATTLTGTLTLSGNATDVFVINVGGVLNTAAGFTVVLVGVPASNVYWRVLGAVNLGANNKFQGTLVAQGAVSVGSGSSLTGGILVTAGAINLDGGIVATATTTASTTTTTTTVAATPAIPVGSLLSFGVYTAAGAISITNGTTVNGALGNDAGAITGFTATSSSVLHQADAAAHVANTDVHTLFAALGAMPCTNTLATFTGSETIAPGTSCFGAATTLTGTLTLGGSATDIYVINVGGVLNTAAGFTVNLGNVLAKNVYWRVLGAVNLGANNKFKGTLVAQGAVSVGSGSTLNGSILVTAGAINLDGGSVASVTAPAVVASATPAPTASALSNFAVYTAAGAISVTNGTTVNGALGNDAGAITGYSGTNVHHADGAADQANIDVHTLFAALGARTCDHTLATFTGGETIASGTSCFGAATTLTGTLTITGNATDKYVIKVGGVLNTAAGFKVVLVGIPASNLSWRVMGAVNLGANNNFQGTLVAEGAVSVGNSSTLNGSILVTAGAINLDGGIVSTATTTASTITASTSSIPVRTLMDFGVYTAAGAISITNGKAVTGDVGNDAGAVTGFVSGSSSKLYQANAITSQANLDVYALFATLGALTCTALPTFAGGETLTAGNYSFGAAASLTGTLYLNAQNNRAAKFNINIGGVLNTAAGFNVVLMNGAMVENITWRVMGAVNLGAGTAFQGTLVAEGAVSVGSNSTLNGSILVTAGAINLDGNTIQSTSSSSTGASASISSISELSYASVQGNFNIIQNPVANNRLRVNMPNAATVTIYSNLGQVLLNKAVEAGTQTITLPILAKGIYHVKCGSVVKKFVVQ